MLLTWSPGHLRRTGPVRGRAEQLADTVCHTSRQMPEVRKEAKTDVTSHQGSPVRKNGNYSASV